MSAQLAHAVAVNSTIIVTWANSALLDFVQSWVAHVRQQGEQGRGESFGGFKTLELGCPCAAAVLLLLGFLAIRCG
jgi:hypothetical protein